MKTTTPTQQPLGQAARAGGVGSTRLRAFLPGLAALLLPLVLLSGCGSGSHSANPGHASARPSPSGCVAAGPQIADHGPSGRPVVALTFDDGPSPNYTPRILQILNRAGARATFFEVGRKIAGRREITRSILRSQDEIGNHSFTHPRLPSASELAATQGAIRSATGFTPCHFRPPYGLLDSSLIDATKRLNMKIALWSVDSYDDHHPGASAIRDRAVSLAQPGSIILMHDGGRHPQTVSALPGMIEGLRARGFSFETVTRLLGGHFVYRGGG